MKHAFITGGARGIGLETARLLLEKGWKIALFDIDRASLESAKSELNSPNLFTYQGSITEPKAIEIALQSFTYNSSGCLHLLVNNAAILEVGDFEKKKLEDHLSVVDINLKGTITCTYTALPFLQKAQGSCIVSLSSASALYGHPEITAYAATKSAVKSLTEAWHLGFRRYGIKVADVLPIFVKTHMVTDYANQYRHLPIESVKLSPADVAKVVWKAVNGNQVHYLVGADTKAYAWLLKVMPGRFIPAIARKVLRYDD